MRMKRLAIAMGSLACLALALSAVQAAEQLKSGPQVNQEVPGPFHPLNVTGPNAGEKFCLYCKNGDHPVAMVFARRLNAPVEKLLQKLDTCTAKNKDAKMGSFAVFLSEDENLAGRLKDVAAKDKLKQTILAVDSPAGPEAYKINKQADVTVVLYTDHKVKANYSFAPGELNDKAIDRVLSEVPKILPKE
jgi:hypothetical protein